MTTFHANEDTLLRINKDNIDIDGKDSHSSFPLPAEDSEERIGIALAVLGNPPPLSEAYASPQDVASDKSLTDGELRFQAINALLALEIRRESLRQQTAEAKQRAKEEEALLGFKTEQLQRLESAYIKTLAKRRWSTAASRAIAETLYNQGARVLHPGEVDPTAPKPETDTAETTTTTTKTTAAKKTAK